MPDSTKADGSDDGSFRPQRWLPAAAYALVALAAIVWVWLTARGSDASFPNALLQAQGVLLTALVFLLGFGQSSLRRSADGTLKQIETWETNVRRAYDDPESMSTLDLFTVAREARDAAISVSVLLAKVQREPAPWRRRLQHFEQGWQGTSLEMMVDVGRIDRELSRASTELKTPSKWRRDYLLKERKRIEATRSLLLSDAQDLGLRGGSRLQSIGGEFAVSLSASINQLRAARLYIVVMITLSLLGAIYAGWLSSWRPAPELWAVLAFPALAGSYALILSSDVAREVARVDRVLAGTWPVVLYTAEGLLGMLYESDDDDRQLGAVIQSSLDTVYDTTISVEWYRSLQARLDLHGPLARLSKGKFRLLEQDLVRLGRAVRLLRSATSQRKDDPVAAIAFSKALEVGPLSVERETPETYVNRAVAVLNSAEVPSTSFGRMLTGAGLAYDVLKTQTLLHPADAALSQRLFAVLNDDPPVVDPS